MKKQAGIAAMAALLIAIAAHPGEAQSAEKTIWEGVYTTAQAARGERLAQQNCTACHSSSEWGHSGFLGAWVGRPIRELHTMIRSSMPMDAPGRLTPQEYADIVAYMLRLANAPAGQTELPATDEGLNRINVTRQAAR
jgi:S-disulfanyl-L-cysteine oxidoreductase SoxD